MSYYSATVLQDNPMAYYRLGELSGTTANDSANTYNGTISGGVTLGARDAIAGDSDAAMTFNGTSGYIALPSSLHIGGLTAFSLECWVNIAAFNAGTYPHIVAADEPGAANNGMMLYLDANAKNIAMQIGNGTTATNCYEFDTLSLNRWYYVVATFDGTNIRIYLNSVLKTTVALSGSIGTPAYAMTIARASSGAGSYFPGTLDEVAVYPSVLSQARITAHYQAAISTPPLAPAGQTPGYYLLINGLDRTKDSDLNNLKIDTSISDRMPQVDLTILDRGCTNPVDLLQEVLILDASQPNQGVNLLLDPVLAQSPVYTVNQSEPQPPNSPTGQWQMSTIDAGTTITTSYPFTLAITNIANFPVMTQWTQKFTVTPGQTYILSMYLNITAPMTNAYAFLEMDFYSFQGVAAGAGGGGSSGRLGGLWQQYTTTSGQQRVSIQMVAPAGTAFIQVQFGIGVTVGLNNSGTAKFSNLQLEPIWFPAAQSYPTPDINVWQVGCYVMPNGTTVRQTRIFAGIIADADPGASDANNGYQGNNRVWTVGCKGPNWILDTQRVNQVFNSQTDQSIIQTIVNTYFAYQLSTNGVQTLATIDQRSYDDNTVTDVLTDLSNTTGGVFYVNNYYDLQYLAVGTVQATYGLSDTPDGVATFGYQYWSCPRDGTQLQNAFIVHGGPFVGTWTDSWTANGSQKQFTLSNAKPKAIQSVTKGGVEQTKGISGNNNFSFSNSQCLVDFPNAQLNFQSNLANGTVVNCTYQYDGQIRAAVIEPDSIAQYNGIEIWGLVNDTNLTTTTAAVQRGMQELAQYAFGLKTPHFKTLLQLTPGQVVLITNAKESLANAPFVVQKVTVVLMGNGVIEYEVECGADIPTFTRLHKRLRRATDKSKHLAGVNYSSITLVVSDNCSVGVDSCSGTPA